MTKQASLLRPATVGPSWASWSLFVLAAALFVLAAALFVLPTLFDVATETWSTPQGGHAPIVAMTGLWLFLRSWPSARALLARGNTAIALTGYLLLLPLYLVTRIVGMAQIEGIAMVAVLGITLYWLCGRRVVAALWFPIFYLLFVFPPPDTVVTIITQPLKIAISQAAIGLYSMLGYPIGGSGVIIVIGQYELLIATACAGLNSLLTLFALGLLYVHVRHGDNWRYALFLAAMILPVAMLANFVRVLLLIAITYHLGDAAAQGFLHGFSGLTLFAAALLAIMLIDRVATPLRQRWAAPATGITGAGQ